MLVSSAFRIKTNKRDIKRDGTAPIYLYLNIEGIRKMISTGKYVNPALFDNERGMVKRGGESTKVNSILEDFRKKYVDAIYDLEFRKKTVTHETVAAMLNKRNEEDFMAFAWEELKGMCFTASPKYYEVLEFHLKTLKTYQPRISFEELNYGFLDKYQKWLINKGYKVNSYAGAFRCIRLFVNKAIKKERTQKNPFANFKIKSQDAHIEYLTLEEVKLLHSLYESGTLTERLQNTLHYFLISSYTGLRRSDCLRLTKKHIEGDCLRILPQKTKKTGKEVRIPLSDRTKRLLNLEMEAFFDRPLKQSYSRTNNDLLEILKSLKITKHITFHCSRHSFAINCLVLGIPIEVVSSILGHSSIKTTQIYAKVVDELKLREMKKWNF